MPSVPLDSPRFQPCRYWQGPTWINVSWLIIDGLRRAGFADEAGALCQRTLALVAKSGFSEYYYPINDGGPRRRPAVRVTWRAHEHAPVALGEGERPGSTRRPFLLAPDNRFGTSPTRSGLPYGCSSSWPWAAGNKQPLS